MKERSYTRDLHDADVVDNMKINAQDYFELCYLRHRYFRKSTNPSPERLAQFESLCKNMSCKVYFKNFQVLNKVGFEQEDLANIARVHVVSFLSMGGLHENPDKMADFIKRHKKKYGQNSELTDKDIFKKECYDLSKFLKQRLADLVRISRGKNKNIRGTADIKMFFKGKTNKNPSDLDLAEYANVYGFERIPRQVFDKTAKKHGIKGQSKFIAENGEIYRAVFLMGEELNVSDIENIEVLDLSQNSHCQDPLEAMIREEEENSLYMEHLKYLNSK